MTEPQTSLREPPTNAPVRSDDPMGRAEILLGSLLRGGVLICVALILLGLAVTLIRHPDYATDRGMLERLTTPGAAFPHTPSAVASELGQFRGRAIITLGLLVLIATPVVRVATSIVVYITQRDWLYVVLTSLVLAILILSGFLGKTG
jgi:uncharacterized membrane protein